MEESAAGTAIDVLGNRAGFKGFSAPFATIMATRGGSREQPVKVDGVVLLRSLYEPLQIYYRAELDFQVSTVEVNSRRVGTPRG